MHKAGNTLDWIIHKEELNCIHNLTKSEFLSDHCIREWRLKKVPSKSLKFEKQSRNLKHITAMDQHLHTQRRNVPHEMQNATNVGRKVISRVAAGQWRGKGDEQSQRHKKNSEISICWQAKDMSNSTDMDTAAICSAVQKISTKGNQEVTFHHMWTVQVNSLNKQEDNKNVWPMWLMTQHNTQVHKFDSELDTGVGCNITSLYMYRTIFGEGD